MNYDDALLIICIVASELSTVISLPNKMGLGGGPKLADLIYILPTEYV